MTQPLVTDVHCACHDHLIELTSWDDGDAYLSLWTPVHTKEDGRFYWAWQSLKGRWNGNTEVCLDGDSVEQLRDALTAHLERAKES